MADATSMGVGRTAWRADEGPLGGAVAAAPTPAGARGAPTGPPNSRDFVAPPPGTGTSEKVAQPSATWPGARPVRPGPHPLAHRPLRPSLLHISTLSDEDEEAEATAGLASATGPRPFSPGAGAIPLSSPLSEAADEDKDAFVGPPFDPDARAALRPPPSGSGRLPTLLERRRAPPLGHPLAGGLPHRPPLDLRRDATPVLLQRAGVLPPRPQPQLSACSPVPQRRVKLFGGYTQYKPLYLLAMGAAGNWLYGTGTVALERGIYPRRPFAPPGAPTSSLPPVLQPLFGSTVGSVTVGGVSTAAGAILALMSCVMFYRDARALARRNNAAQPSYTRANAYFAAHLVGIALSVGSKFATEALRDLFPRQFVWAAVVPGQAGQALFAVTQAQAFSTSELYNGKMPLRHRSSIGFAARFCVGLYTLYGVLQGIPYLSSYGKEVVRLSSVTAATLAYALPLTTARIERHAPNLPASVRYGERPRDNWHALNLLGVFFVGRLLAGFGPDLIQRGVQIGIRTNEFPPIAGPVFGGASLLALGTATCVTAIMLFRQDVAAYDVRKANFWSGLAMLGLLLLETYRGIFELSIVRRDTQLAYFSAIPGIIGTGLRLAVMPELFCYSELLRGTLPLKQRYHWTESCRGAAQMLLGIWGATCSVPGFDPFAREAIFASAGIFATLGMALPTTVSRQRLPQYTWPLSPGATPAAENRDPFSLLSLDALVVGPDGARRGETTRTRSETAPGSA